MYLSYLTLTFKVILQFLNIFFRSSGNLKAPAGKNDGIDMGQFDYPDEQAGEKHCSKN